MYPSLYNIIISIDENKSILFNSFSRKFIVLSSRFVPQYNEIINNPSKYKENSAYTQFIEDMLSGGFIISNLGDQLKTIKKLQQSKNDKSNYCLSIYTTLECNYKCWYCVQNHQNNELGLDMQDRIIKHINKVTNDKEVKQVSISWFGGEPFLNFESITRISNAIMTICKNRGVEYNCDFTTNASLINKRTIDEIRPFNISSFQITIDGSKVFHNKTKFNSSITDAFDTTLKSIILLANELPKTNVFVRINYTGKNLLESFVEEIDQYLYSVKDKIYIFFRKVWQIEDTQEIRQKNREIMIKLKDKGYNIIHDFDHLGLLNCISEQENYYSIFPNGSVSKCANVDIVKANGILCQDGTVKFNSNDSSIPPVSDQCNNCKYYPICLGPCPRERMKRNISCKFENKSADDYFNNEILNYYYLNCDV